MNFGNQLHLPPHSAQKTIDNWKAQTPELDEFVDDNEQIAAAKLAAARMMAAGVSHAAEINVVASAAFKEPVSNSWRNSNAPPGIRS